MKLPPPTVPRIRTFAFALAGLLALLGALALRRGSLAAWVELPLAGVLALAAAIVPRALAGPYRVWMAVGAAIGLVMSRVILGVFFFAVIAPVAWAMRLAGRDRLALRRRSVGWLPTNPDDRGKARYHSRFLRE